MQTTCRRAGDLICQKQLVKEVTEIVVKISSDPSQAGRTWALLTEGAEGGRVLRGQLKAAKSSPP